jgi:lipoprotein NlpI
MKYCLLPNTLNPIAIYLSIISIGILPQSARGLSSVEVGRIAKAVTVTIDGGDSVGSGVIMEKNSSGYDILTAAHVVRNRKLTYKILTPDGQEYKIVKINALKDTDLAVVTFNSRANYPLVKLGDSRKSTEGATVFVAGFPLATRAITSSIYSFTEGRVTANANLPLADGYSLVYSNNTLPGMSGGPVLNDAGELIAIHGKGDVEEKVQTSEINEDVRIKTGFNLGIATTTIFKLANNLGLKFTEKNSFTNDAIVASAPTADDYFVRGVERFNRHDWGGAIENMNLAVKVNPKYTRAYIAKAAANFMSNRIAAALDDADLAIASNPKSPIALVSKCFFLNSFGKKGQALGYCDQAIKLNPQLAMAYNVRGLVNTELNNLSGANRDLQYSIELDPKSYYPYGNLGVVEFRRNNPQVALQYTRQALQLNPQSAAIHSQLGQLLVATKNYQLGIGELNRSIGLNPRLGASYQFRALAYLALGNTAQARIDTQIGDQLVRSSPTALIEDLSFLNQ